MVLFAATTIRMMLENYLKYGIRLNPKNWVLAVVTPEGSAIFTGVMPCALGWLSCCDIHGMLEDKLQLRTATA